jgi:hypothetical protein
MGDEPHDTHQELWEKYTEVGHGRAGATSEQTTRPGSRPGPPNESQEELVRLAEEDQRELRSGDEVWYKHIDELTREDRPARIQSENARTAWIRERLSRQPRPQ